MNDTVARIERIFSESLGVTVPSPTADLLATGTLDSLGLVTLLFELEQEFGVAVPMDVEIESLRSVERLAELVDSSART